MKIKKWKNSRRHPPTCSTLFRPRFMGTFFGIGKIVWKSAVGFFVSLPFRERKRGRERKNSIDPADWSRKREGIVDERWLPREADVLSRRQLHHHLPGSWFTRRTPCLWLRHGRISAADIAIFGVKNETNRRPTVSCLSNRFIDRSWLERRYSQRRSHPLELC